MSEISSGTVQIAGPPEASDGRRQAFERIALGVVGAVANGRATLTDGTGCSRITQSMLFLSINSLSLPGSSPLLVIMAVLPVP